MDDKKKRRRWRFPMKDLEVTVWNEPEDLEVHGNVNDEAEKWIMKEVEAGNEWAWCYVRVRVTHRPSGVYGEDTLGGCSYESEADFLKGGYYEDMVHEARSEMENNLADMKRRERKKPTFALKADLVVTRNGRRYFQIVPHRSVQMYSVGHLAQRVVHLLNLHGEQS